MLTMCWVVIWAGVLTMRWGIAPFTMLLVGSHLGGAALGGTTVLTMCRVGSLGSLQCIGRVLNMCWDHLGGGAHHVLGGITWARHHLRGEPNLGEITWVG